MKTKNPFALVLLLFLSIFFQSQAHAFDDDDNSAPDRYQGPFHCTYYHSDFRKKDVRYCVDRSRPDLPAQPGEAVVYFMHGMHGNAKHWIVNSYAGNLDRLRKENKFQTPVTFVSFDTAGTSFFTDAKEVHEGAKAYETWFIHEFIPFIEKELHVCSVRACRGIAGVSMGGLGAIKTALRHPELFFVAAGNSPALPPFNLYEPTSRWLDYWKHTPTGEARGYIILRTVRDIIPDADDSDRHDPAWIVSHWNPADERPALYFDMGGKDTFGFEIGYARFLQSLNFNNWNYEATLIPGQPHGVFHERSLNLLEFLADKFASPK